MNQSLVLASASPRRRELLSLAGYQYDVEVADIDESAIESSNAYQIVEHLACAKAQFISAKHPARFVVGADTIVVAKDSEGIPVVLGKPEGKDDARTMLELLSDSTHEVLTAYCISHSVQDILFSRVVTTEVSFRKLESVEIEIYLDSKDPFDKAGAYGIQGFAGCFVEKISGSYLNVVGLPVSQLVSDLNKLGISRF